MAELSSLIYGLAAVLIVAGVIALCSFVKATVKKILKKQDQEGPPDENHDTSQ